jgi:hypothetical protein
MPEGAAERAGQHGRRLDGIAKLAVAILPRPLNSLEACASRCHAEDSERIDHVTKLRAGAVARVIPNTRFAALEGRPAG